MMYAKSSQRKHKEPSAVKELRVFLNGDYSTLSTGLLVLEDAGSNWNERKRTPGEIFPKNAN